MQVRGMVGGEVGGGGGGVVVGGGGVGVFFFFFQAEDGIRDYKVTGVQTCALPIWTGRLRPRSSRNSSICASR